MNTIIKVENLGKKYILSHQTKGSYATLRDVIAESAKKMRKRILKPFSSNYESDPTHEEFWALKDVSFEVKQGERMGIIGRNGAGKTTILKILSRITEPTTGRVRIKGRVASLLEVGTGFHPELTGRENVYLNGAILGMSKVEIKKKFDEIVAFAEIEKFLDTPVKRYSSGMYVRLAFAVAAHLEPEILIVDEVLAVGDAQFQKKCLGKMEDVAKEGRTVLFVSHNMAAINVLCTKTVVLAQGRTAYMGDTGSAVKYYMENLTSEAERSGRVRFKENPSIPIQMSYILVTNEEGTVTREIEYQKKYFFEIGLNLRQKDKNYYAIIEVKDVYGNIIFMTVDDDIIESRLATMDPGGYIYRIEFPAKLLKPGEYFFEVILSRKHLAGNSDTLDLCTVSLEIHDRFSRRGLKNMYRTPAIIAPEIPWEII